ncbi:MAG: rod shape-determining protein RodA, partial [Ruminococcus sp.]|nr:rod shape-determining protein RodA [Ruminococcus sp.]
MSKFSKTFADYFKRSDILLWLLTITAIIYSLLIISSMQRSANYNYLKIQIIAVTIGLVAAFVISAADYRYFVRKWYFAAGIAVFLAI